MHLFELRLVDLRKIVKDLKPSNASGVDSINSRVIKDCMPQIEDCLLHMVNLSLGTGVFPASLKIAKIIPLLKPGKDPMDQASNRPISNLSILGKILEKAGFSQIMEHINHNRLINDRHHGGRKGHSTSTCVLEVLNEVNKAKEKKLLTGILSIDMSAAYDLVDHNILILKLKNEMNLAPHTLLWVQDFLKQRTQRVEICGKLSSSLESGEQGIVQGGSSSGDLFIIYMNEIPNCNPLPDCERPDANTSQYVDDINMVAYGKTKKLLKLALQRCYDNMERILSDHRMVINGGKTQLMIITNKKDLKSITILAGGQNIVHQENLRILGLTLSASQKFDTHITEEKTSLVNSVYRQMSILKNIQKFVNKSTLATIGASLIGSTISYGAPVWSQTSNRNIEALQIAQTKAARLVDGIKWKNQGKRDHRQDVFNNLGWKNVKQIIVSANLNLLKQASESKSSKSVNQMFRQSIQKHNRGLEVIRMDFNGN